MAKKSKTPEPGHNSGLTDEEVAALQHHFSIKIREQQRKAAIAKATYDSERDGVNKLFSSARGELGINRKEFEEVLALQDMTEAEFLNHERKRHGRMLAQGLPVGTQMDLFPKADAADDQARAHADGYRAGRRADDPIPPDHVASVFGADWMRGWEEGQAENMKQFTLAGEVIARREADKNKGKVVLEEEPAEQDEEAGIDADLKALEAKGWTQPTSDEEQLGAAA